MTKKVIDMAGDIPIFFEPGRSLIGQAGSLVTEVLGVKINGTNRFLIVDAGMNDLIRPALYQANHKIEAISASDETLQKYYVVGPVCETADSFGEFSISAQQHDHLIISNSGEVIEFCDPRINTIKQTIEEVFDVTIDSHSLYFYGKKNKKK